MPKTLPISKTTLILGGIIIFLLVGGFFAYQKFVAGAENSVPVEEVDLNFDPDGPYALLVPRRDGNALVLNIKRTASYDKITYELAYSSEGIDRGVMGEINTKEKKGEYEQEILFGTCSKNVCKYDKDVENGTLTLHIRKGKEAFRMVTQWHLQKPDMALGKLSSGDGHFSYNITSSPSDLSLVKFTIINDLTGIPKLPFDMQVLGKVYALNTPLAKVLPAGTVNIELAQNPPEGSKIARFNEGENKWIIHDTFIKENKLSAKGDNGGVFTILIPKK